jgi:phosphoribosylamine---glycine ligase
VVDLFEAVGQSTLNAVNLEIDDRTAATVIAVSGGYPEAYQKNKRITGLENIKESLVFHAGTKSADGDILSYGGRVLAITSFGADKEEALAKSYRSLQQISFEGMNYRKDIGFDL